MGASTPRDTDTGTMCDPTGLAEAWIGLECSVSIFSPLYSSELAADSDPAAMSDGESALVKSRSHNKSEDLENSAMLEKSEKPEMSEELENSAVSASGVGAGPTLAATPAPLLPVFVAPVVPANPAGGPAGPAQEFWQWMQRGLEWQQQWMRLISQVIYGLPRLTDAESVCVRRLRRAGFPPGPFRGALQ